MKTTQTYYRIESRKISFIKFIFEAYEGVATLTTIDASCGDIMVAIAPGCEAIIKEIMAEMSEKFLVEIYPKSNDTLADYDMKIE